MGVFYNNHAFENFIEMLVTFHSLFNGWSFTGKNRVSGNPLQKDKVLVNSSILDVIESQVE